MKRTPLLGIAALTTLAACATTAPDPALGPATPTAADNHRIAVEQTSERVALSVRPDEVALTHEAQGDLSVFARSYIRIGHGPVVVSVPESGPNADAAARIAQAARLHLADSGVPYGAIAGATYDATGVNDAPVVLSFARFTATAPECAPLWTQDLAHPDANQPWESFGCATNANLAAMIEDPADLLGPRTEDARDSGRRAVVFDNYRRGQTTAASRTPAETATISSAVR
ncbi:MAG: CpaD family pilus assembly protein [Hyphomonadaceae bacterium]|nr:CpaD family pilus assembly protein [Hyphomonadaceae bacterium]